MDKPTRFRKSIQYIEEQLNSDICLEEAAQAGFISLMQLYRDCYTYTGHSVKEYIRKRRLSNALGLIKCSDMSLADIAYASGYSSQQALCKSVREAVAMTPTEYKKSEAGYYFPRFDNEAARQVTVALEAIPQTLWVRFYHPRLEGIEQEALAALYSLLPAYKGRVFGRNGEQLGCRFCYELAVEYASGLADKLADSVFTHAAIQPEACRTYAKTTVANEEKSIIQAWNYLYTDWLKTSMFTLASDSCMEEYLSSGGGVKKLVLYVPVRKRTDYDRISLTWYEGGLFLAASRMGLRAEEEASRAVVSFLEEHRPGAVSAAGQFYVARDGSACTCGIRLEEELMLPPDRGLELLQIAPGGCAMLESGCCSDSRVLEAILHTWLKENGLEVDTGPTFTIYETGGGYEPEAIRTKIRVKLKKC
jgi:AraC family transcriptional regulator